MNLCIDIGNSRIKYLVLDGTSEKQFFTSEDFDIDQLETIFLAFDIQNAIYSSTRHIPEDWLNFLFNRCKLINVGDNDVVIPLEIEYETPETLGKDRIAAALAAKVLFPGQACVIISAGTCLTYDLVNGQGIFQGGNIAPGLNMRLKAMHHYTDKLPLAPLMYHEEVLGKSTVKALQNGAVRGAIYEIRSFLDEIVLKHEHVKVIVTGGDSKIFVDHLKIKIFAVPNLVLRGLNEILRYNADQ